MQPRICEQCERSFTVPYRVTAKRWATRRFCSPECSATASRGRVSSRKGVEKVTLAERFWSKVDKSGGDCWLWRGATEVGGYGYLAGTRGRTSIKAHRLSYILHNGDIPDGLVVCHSCDNPPCVNPAHLWLGTRRDNNQDKVDKGRQPSHKGETNPRSKITWAQRDEIIALVASGKTQIEVARMYDIDQTQVSRIVRGTHWIR